MHPRCKQFGFDQKKIQRRLSFLKLSSADRRIAQRLHTQVIDSNVKTIIDAFYEKLLFQTESRQWLLTGEIVHKLKATQEQYLLSLGIDFDQPDYFEQRLQIGIVHVTINLPMNIYQCAYSNLIQLLIDAIPESIKNNVEEYTALIHFIIKITSLDMSLAVETYHDSSVHELEEQVKTLDQHKLRLQDLAQSDPLTGLYNRNYVFDYLGKAIEEALASANHLCLLMLDIDHFKNVNDTYGHQAGDLVIKKAAECISRNLRGNDIVGRYGGEEFIVGLAGVSPEIAIRAAERICYSIRREKVIFENHIISITISAGLATLNDSDNLQTLIKRADAALYNAKQSGRDRVING